MRKRLLVIIISITLLLSACSPRIIDEAKAKEAGLALINRAFNANEAEASVEYQARPATFYQDGTTGETVTLEPDRVYVVKTALEKGESDYYYAEVDAVTGVAFRAERYLSGIVLTEEQQKQADALGTLDDFNPDDFILTQQDAVSNIMDIIKERLEPEIPLLRMYPDIIESDSVDFPKVLLEYLVIMEGGKVYDLTLCWPTMELVKVYIRN